MKVKIRYVAVFAFLLALTSCPHSVPELANPADPEASTPIDTLEFEDANLREAVIESAEEGGWEYSQDIERVSANWRDVESLEGIQFLFSLDDLSVEGNAIESIGPLESFDEFSRLNISDNNISNLEPVGGMSIHTLILRHNPIEDLSPAADVSDVRDLRIENVNLDIEEVYSLAETADYWSDLRDLEVYVGEGAATDVRRLDLASNSSLRGLRLGPDELENLNDIRELSELAHLGLLDVSLTETEHGGLFDDLDSLHTIELYNVDADEATLESLGIGKAGELDDLVVLNDEMTDAEFAAGLEYVEWLDIGGDNLQSLDGLNEVGRINVLMASGSPDLSDVSALRNHSLRELNLRDSAVDNDDVADIVASMADDAWQVSLSDTGITDVSGFGDLNSASLDLQGIAIEEGLSDLTNLDDPEFIDLGLTGVEETLPDELDELIERFGEDVVRY
ncbi:MAG: hypothetical protein ACLFM0_10425 [Spirochaetales bacterium]